MPRSDVPGKFPTPFRPRSLRSRVVPQDGHGTQDIRAIVTGQVGLDKTPYLEAVAREVEAIRKRAVFVVNIGERMYDEDPSIPEGEILKLDRKRLTALRRSVWRDMLHGLQPGSDVIVNAHAMFRWHHGPFAALDFDLLRRLKPTVWFTLVDNFDSVHARLIADHSIAHNLRDILVWREEEALTTQLYAAGIGSEPHYILGRGRTTVTTSTMARLIAQPGILRVYPSFPMTHVVGMPEVLNEIDAFKNALRPHMVLFDPADVDEFEIIRAAVVAAEKGQTQVVVMNDGKQFALDVQELLYIRKDIEGQIVDRDLRLIDQANLIVSFIPEMPSGMPGLSSGVERELEYALRSGKQVYVVWKSKRMPSPFISANADAVFPSVETLLQHFHECGLLGTA